MVLDILCVTYFLASVTMTDPQTRLTICFRTVDDVSASSGISSP